VGANPNTEPGVEFRKPLEVLRNPASHPCPGFAGGPSRTIRHRKTPAGHVPDAAQFAGSEKVVAPPNQGPKSDRACSRGRAWYAAIQEEAPLARMRRGGPVYDRRRRAGWLADAKVSPKQTASSDFTRTALDC